MRIIRVNDFYVMIKDDEDPLLHFDDFEPNFTDDERYDIINQWCDATITDEQKKETL